MIIARKIINSIKVDEWAYKYYRFLFRGKKLSTDTLKAILAFREIDKPKELFDEIKNNALIYDYKGSTGTEYWTVAGKRSIIKICDSLRDIVVLTQRYDWGSGFPENMPA